MLRPFLALSLALIIALTSGAMAVARGQTSAAGAIVLCTGTGPLSVQVDADGQPIGPLHICPDCALGLFDTASSTPPTLATPALTCARIPAITLATATAFLLPHRPRARAPPFV